MKPICIIPARSGSKGLKNKNVLFLNKRPMIYYTIQAALDSKLFDKEDIYVSTDSDLYASLCAKLGVSIHFRREGLANDTATTYDVLNDFLNDYDSEQCFVLLQPTSPLRTSSQIRDAYKIFESEFPENVVSYTEVDKSPVLFTEISEDGYIIDNLGLDKGYRRQNFNKLYYPNGAIYISKKGTYLNNKSFYTEKTKAFLMAKETSYDVDDKQDFFQVEGYLQLNEFRHVDQNKNIIKNNVKKTMSKLIDNLILADTRIGNFVLPNFNSIILPNLSLLNILQNIDLLKDKVKNCLFLSVGTNDIISGVGSELIKKRINDILEYFPNQRIYITTIPEVIHRVELDNDIIININEHIKQLENFDNVFVIDLNEVLSKNYCDRIFQTIDGLYFTENTNELMYNYIIQKINFN